MKYKILYSADPDSLAKLVNEALAGGWVVAGGVAIHPYGRYLQAIVKNTD